MPNVADVFDTRQPLAGDLETIARISTGPIANKRSFIAESFARRTIVGAFTGQRLVGYAIWDRAFFGRPFVWLLGVDPVFRRQGIAALLLHEFSSQCRGEALFTSTNESNVAMQSVLARSGFVRSGCVDNLDPGDPEVFYFKPPAQASPDE